VWTDVFQSVIMLAGLVTVAVVGSVEVGGVTKVWEINQNYGRINFFEYVHNTEVFIILSKKPNAFYLSFALGEEYAVLLWTGLPTLVVACQSSQS